MQSVHNKTHTFLQNVLQIKTDEQQAAVHQHEDRRGGRRGVQEGVPQHAEQPTRKILPAQEAPQGPARHQARTQKCELKVAVSEFKNFSCCLKHLFLR